MNNSNTGTYIEYSNADNATKTHILISYILVLLGLFTAIPMLIGAIWAMLKRKSAAGTLYHSHFTNVIRVFWWSLAWTIIGCILAFVMVGYAVLFITWIWALYRLMTGLVRLVAGEAYQL